MLSDLGSLVVEPPEDGATDLREVGLDPCAEGVDHHPKRIEHHHILHRGVGRRGGTQGVGGEVVRKGWGERWYAKGGGGRGGTQGGWGVGGRGGTYTRGVRWGGGIRRGWGGE